MRTTFDCRLWKDDEWDKQKNYAVVVYFSTKEINECGCLQKFFEFTNLDVLKGFNITWENRASADVGEVHGQFCEQDDYQFQCVCEILQLLDGQDLFDNIQFIPKDEQNDVKDPDDELIKNIARKKDQYDAICSGDDDPSEIHLIWDTDFTKSLSARKIQLGLNDETKMGTAWSIDHRPDGSTVCIFVAVSDKEFERFKNQVEKWKGDDRLAYSRVEYIDNREIIMSDEEDDAMLASCIEQENHNVFCPSFSAEKKRAFYGDVETVEEIGDYVEEWNSLKKLKYNAEAHPLRFSESNQKAKKRHYANKRREAKKKKGDNQSKSSNDLKESVETKVVHQTRSKYRDLPPEPKGEYGKKCEKIFYPIIYAKRHDIYEKHKKHKYFRQWKDANSLVLIKPISNGFDHYDLSSKMLPVGDGNFFNGWYVVEKRDLYYDRDGDGMPHRLVRYWGWAPVAINKYPGCEDTAFPEWKHYLPWYYRGGGEGYFELCRDPAYSSDGEEFLYPEEYEMSDFCLTSTDEDDASGGTVDD